MNIFQALGQDVDYPFHDNIEHQISHIIDVPQEFNLKLDEGLQSAYVEGTVAAHACQFPPHGKNSTPNLATSII